MVKKNVKTKTTVKKAKKKSAAKGKPKRSKLEEKMAEFGRQVAALEMKAAVPEPSDQGNGCYVLSIPR